VPRNRHKSPGPATRVLEQDGEVALALPYLGVNGAIPAARPPHTVGTGGGECLQTLWEHCAPLAPFSAYGHTGPDPRIYSSTQPVDHTVREIRERRTGSLPKRAFRAAFLRLHGCRCSSRLRKSPAHTALRRWGRMANPCLYVPSCCLGGFGRQRTPSQTLFVVNVAV
jgi:hypothetical protein